MVAPLRIRTQNQLAEKMDSGEARAVTLLLFEHLFGMTTAEVLAGGDETLTLPQQKQLAAYVDLLTAGEPVQYVLGSTRFLDMDIEVGPGVLIPRPETEELVRLVAAENTDQTGGHLLDIGTGSGCIALGLKRLLPQFDVTGWDVSDEALAIAEKNRLSTGLDVTFERHDILDGTMAVNRSDQRFDLIVSNPPYICEQEKAAMEPHVLLHEPHLALFVPDSRPLLFYEAIIPFAMSALRPGGKLYFEVNRRFATDVALLMETVGFRQVEVRSDQFGNPRFVSGTKQRS